MKNKISSFLKKYQFLLYSFLVSFCILLFTSKNSFLYPINDWVDANAFFTVGKSMFRGVVPYRDLFEQKGLLLYFIYGLGSLFSYKNFVGVFFIEILFFTIFLYYVHKISSFFIDKKYSYLLLPLLSFLITTSISFVHGGACEEFCFPFFAISLYYYCKHFKEKELTNKEYLLNGFLAGCVFMIKYTLLGFWFGFMAFLFFDLLLRKKRVKDSFVACICFLIGMFIPILVSFLYFIYHGALKDFIDAYFIINMTAYNRETSTLLEKIYTLYKSFIGSLLDNGFLLFFGILFLPCYVKNLKIDAYFKGSIIAIFLISVLGLFWGLRFYKYYMLPVFIFLPFVLIFLLTLCSNYLEKYKKYYCILSMVVFLGCVALSYTNANYKEMLFLDKKQCFLYKYAEYINTFESPTLLNMGYLDAGLYTTTGIVPNTKFFEVQNIHYEAFPANLDDMKNSVVNKKVKFILYYTRKSLEEVKEKDAYIFTNYTLVFDDTYLFENATYNAFLFQVKDL